MKMAIFNAVCYGIGWFWSGFFGVNGRPLTTFLGVLFLMAIQLAFTKWQSPILFIQDILIIPFCLFFGFILEMILIQTGVVQYAGSASSFPPLWIMNFYMLLSLLINHSLQKALTNQRVTFAWGFFLTPLSYFICEAYSGLSFSYNYLITWGIIGLLWAIFLCFMRAIANSIETAAEKTWKEKDNAADLKFFYDGACPICNREVCYLEKNESKNSMQFIDISSKAFLKESKHLDYGTAMSQMHAIDDQGNLLVGLDAFANAYARCNMLFLSTVLNVQFLRPVLDPMYRLFARHRLLITGRSNK